MSLVYRRLVAISLPTVAAFLSILWLRNRRKGRHLPADSSSPEKEKSSEDLVLVFEKAENNSTAGNIDCKNSEDNLTSDVCESLVSGCGSEVCTEYIENSLFSSNSSEVIELVDCPIEKTVQEGLGSEVVHICEPEEDYCSSEELEEVEIEEIAAELDLVERSAEVLNLIKTPVEVLEEVEAPVEVIEDIIGVSAEVLEEVKAPTKVIEDIIEVPVEVLEEAKASAEVIKDVEVPVEIVETPAKVIEGIVETPAEVVEDLKKASILKEESYTETVGDYSKVPVETAPEKIEMKKEKEQIKEAINTLELDKMKETGQLADKLASLELDQMKIDERKTNSERDSANHSPSEIMLASPSISNFSDAHSEGSSDSGKGQSDVAISPSRTPAGGSSLAGDQAPSVYEFILPQVIVGRLIGRHGVFLNEIKTQTHTNIFIKRHPDSNKLKICAIEGTQQDIDKALAKIRQKFPLRRFPQLTLEKVSFVQLNPLPPLKPEDFHLQLVEGVNNDVVLSSLITAAHFFLQQPCHPSYSSLTALNTIMTQIYSSGEAPALEAPVNYAVCAAPAMEGWYRAQIIQVDEDGLHCTVKYLDYGGYSRIPATDLRQIRGDLLALPFQAVECYLANVAPAGEEWSDEARLFVHGLTCGQILHAQVYDYAEDGAPLVYLYSSFGNQVVLINEQLVVNGYAVIAEQGSCCGTTSEDGGRTDEEATKSERDTE